MGDPIALVVGFVLAVSMATNVVVLLVYVGLRMRVRQAPLHLAREALMGVASRRHDVRGHSIHLLLDGRVEVACVDDIDHCCHRTMDRDVIYQAEDASVEIPQSLREDPPE